MGYFPSSPVDGVLKVVGEDCMDQQTSLLFSLPNQVHISPWASLVSQTVRFEGIAQQSGL